FEIDEVRDRHHPWLYLAQLFGQFVGGEDEIGGLGHGPGRPDVGNLQIRVDPQLPQRFLRLHAQQQSAAESHPTHGKDLHVSVICEARSAEAISPVARGVSPVGAPATPFCHCEARRAEAISSLAVDCFATLAMRMNSRSPRPFGARDGRRGTPFHPRPSLRTSRRSYSVITPSTSRGVLAAISAARRVGSSSSSASVARPCTCDELSGA